MPEILSYASGSTNALPAPPAAPHPRRGHYSIAIATLVGAGCLIGFCFAAGDRFELQLTVINCTSEPIDRFELQFGEDTTLLRDIPSGATITRTVKLSGQASLRFLLVPHDQPYRFGSISNELDSDSHLGALTFRVTSDGLEITPPVGSD